MKVVTHSTQRTLEVYLGLVDLELINILHPPIFHINTTLHSSSFLAIEWRVLQESSFPQLL